MKPPQTPRSAVVVNPAKVTDAAALRDELTAILTTAGWPEPTWYETSIDDPGGGVTAAGVRDGAEVMFVCGGDGTVMSCAGALAGTGTAMAVVPSGTGNLLAANLGLPTDRADAIRLAVGGGRRRIDVGVVGDECFTVMAGMGFDAHLLDATPESLKARLGWRAYLIGGIRRIADRPMRVAIRIDEHPPVRRRARAVLIANVGGLPGGLRLLPDSSPDDGELDVAILTPRSLWHWLAMGTALLRRRNRLPRVELMRGRDVTVSSDVPQSRELDGNVIASDRTLHATVRPASLVLCVPRPDERRE